jgi:DNA polymerase
VLESVGVSREAVFITNIVKCRPPRNRPPTRWESETCIDSHLRRQLKAIDPELVVLMGRTATRALLGADSLGEVRGKIVARGRTKFLSTYHPAAVLRNPRLKSTLAKDLRKIHTT